MTDTNPWIPECDKRPMRGCWAPGSYMNRCAACWGDFTGDKRALTCAPCSYGDGLRRFRWFRHLLYIWRSR